MRRLSVCSIGRIILPPRFDPERVCQNTPAVPVPGRTETEDVRGGSSRRQEADEKKSKWPSGLLFDLAYHMLVQRIFRHCPKESPDGRCHEFRPAGFIGPLVRGNAGQRNEMIAIVPNP